MTRPLRATYRVQLRPSFGFDAAVGILDHLARLGVSHLYTSPVLEAVPGSEHGYDVADPTRVRDELGGADGLDRLVAALHERSMGWVVDIVPNHQSVAVPSANPRWWQLLAEGPSSEAARFFDVDWDRGAGRVVLPVLGAALEDEVASGAVELRRRDDGTTVVAYHDLELPLAEGTDATGDVRAVLDAQHYRPSYWRAADRNYRVFFDIDSLAGMRVEDDQVFEETHRRVAEWVDRGMVDGVRVDHVDGLTDPDGYLDRLRRLIGPDRALWVEKILLPGEELPRSWPVEGTTGYEFARVATAAAVEPSSVTTFDRLWEGVDGEPDYEVVEEAAKRDAARVRLGPELERLADQAAVLEPTAARDDLRETLVELAVGFPVYRSYGVGTAALDDRDRANLDTAVDHAKRRLPELTSEIERIAAHLRSPTSDEAAAMRARFQQFTGPAMAKGAEDTAFYRYHRLIALSEVGGDPATFGVEPTVVHRQLGDTARSWPSTMLAASTHDTKRSADVRARLAALTHAPDLWEETLVRWRGSVEDRRPPQLDGPTELLFWQTAVGAWPIDEDRMTAYLEKAIRESGRHTTWTEPDETYEGAVTGFARQVLADDDLSADVDRFVSALDPVGRAVRIGEVVLRLVGPGVPDTYQGDQDHDRSLVDPDNRRPVDHQAIDARLLDALEVADVDRLVVAPGSPAKLWTTHRLLRLRAERWADLGPDGGYEPLAVNGAPSRVVAFRRGDVVAVVDLRPGLGPVDETASVELPEGTWDDVLRRTGPVSGGASVGVGSLWQVVPAAVLVRR